MQKIMLVIALLCLVSACGGGGRNSTWSNYDAGGSSGDAFGACESDDLPTFSCD